MKGITAILIHYEERSLVEKALDSLNQFGKELTHIFVFQETQFTLDQPYKNDRRIRFVSIGNKDLGELINDTVRQLTSSHVLFLSNPDYLAPNVSGKMLDTTQKHPIGTSITHRRQSVWRPVMIPRTYMLHHPLSSHSQLPFKEALLPSWLFQTNRDDWSWKKDLLRHQQTNTFPDTRQKNNFLSKYQLFNKMEIQHPSVSIMIANYNMGDYLQTAISSCFLQTVEPEEVLIIDDGSTDQSRELLEEWEKRTNVKVLYKQNGGKARALNTLLPNVTTDFVLELDADDWLDPDAIQVVKTHVKDVPKKASLLYGNLRRWKQMENSADVSYKTTSQGSPVNDWTQLQKYPLPLGPRIYRTSQLKKHGGFPILEFADGRLYEDVSVLKKLVKDTPFVYQNFTVYNVREHKQSVTKQQQATWKDFIQAWEEEDNT